MTDKLKASWKSKSSETDEATEQYGTGAQRLPTRERRAKFHKQSLRSCSVLPSNFQEPLTHMRQTISNQQSSISNE